MTQSYEFSLNEFHASIAAAFKAAKNESFLNDTWYGSSDGQCIQANKFILSASSKQMLNILKNTEHQKPGITHVGAKFEEIQTINNYLHTGETSEERPLRFLHLGAELEIDGLIMFCSPTECYKIEETFCVAGSIIDKDGICSIECYRNSIFSSFTRLRDEKFLHDVSFITVDNKQIHLHKMVLYTFSMYFKNLMKTKKMKRRVKIPYSEEEVKLMLELLYTGTVKIGKKNVQQFIEMLTTFEITNFTEEANEELTEEFVDSPNKEESNVEIKDKFEITTNVSNNQSCGPELQDILSISQIVDQLVNFSIEKASIRKNSFKIIEDIIQSMPFN